MCFPYDAEPPVPQILGAAVENENLTLKAADGNEFSAFLAKGDGSQRATVLILPDVRGLFHFYEELALRFAERNIDSLAIDYFGRTAGLGVRAEEFPWQEHVAQSTFEGVKNDVTAAVEHLRLQDSSRPIFTLGFCFGGSNSWHQAANGHALAGAIGFYGHPDRPDFPQGASGVIERVADISCPILGLMGGADQGIPSDIVNKFDEELTASSIDHQIVTYPGAPHSFFDRHFEEFASESADAWEKVLAFISENS